jgi:hypothetical protein
MLLAPTDAALHADTYFCCLFCPTGQQPFPTDFLLHGFGRFCVVGRAEQM